MVDPESVDSAYAVRAAPAARAATASPRGQKRRVLPTGPRRKGSASRVPSTVVARSHSGVATAPRGRNVTSS
jgi:hypothetical protein